MNTLSRCLLLSLALGAAVFAADAPGSTTPAGGPGGGGGPGGWGGGGGGWMKRMVDENPELKGVDLQSPEGREKLQKVMAKGMAKRMAEARAEEHTNLKTSFGMSDEEWGVVEPLVTKVEVLRNEKRAVDSSMMPAMPGGGRGGNGGRPGGGGFGGGPGGPPGGFAAMLLGDTPLDPAAQEVQDAAKALKTLLEDTQANGAEVTAAVTRLRKGKEALSANLKKAEDDLQGVLTPKQEAILVDKGILE